MARDWSETESVREDIFNRMAKFGANIAPVPFSEYLANEDGELKWIVDIHIKVKRLVEFELTGEGSTLAEALRRVYLGLNNEGHLRKNAHRANAVFGLVS